MALFALATAACGSSGGAALHVAPARSCGAGAALSVPGEAPYDVWTWVGCADTACANGSPAGMAVMPHEGATTTLIYLEAGGVCWDYDTCVANPTAANLSGVGPDGVGPDVDPPGSVFDRSVGANPLRDANYVFIPYCTGDLHGGDKVTVYGGTPISHTGYRNFGAYLATLAPTFASSSLVVLAGSSAGGYGAIFNYERTKEAFANVGSARVAVVADAGPPLRPPYFPTALQQVFDASWNLFANLPSGCTDCSPNLPGGGLHNLWSYYANHPPFVASLLSAAQDQGISLSFSPPPGDADLVCSPTNAADVCDFNPGLEDSLDAILEPASRLAEVRSFVVSGYQHTFLQTPIASVVGEDGTRLTDFLAEEFDGQASWSSSVCDGTKAGGCICNALANTAEQVAEISTATSAPVPAGGVLASGAYRCVADTLHRNGGATTTTEWRSTMLVEAAPDGSSARIQEVASVNGAPDAASTMSVAVAAGGTLVGNTTCPSTQPVRFGYTAVPGQLTFYETLGDGSVREALYLRAGD
jgi:Pectinacetylesterase